MDYERLKKYQEEIADLQRQLKFAGFKDLIIEKILDFYARQKVEDQAQIREEIETIFHPFYKSFKGEIYSKYDHTITVINDLYKDMGVDIQRDFNKIQALEKTLETRLGNYETSAVSELAKITRKALIGDKVDFKEYRMRLFGVGDRISTYADVLARTGIKGYSRECKNQKALIAEINWYEYVGFIREHTRPECLWCLEKKMFNLEDIKAQDNKKFSGQLKPFRIYCGGWNCHHDLEPEPFYKGKK